MPASCRNFANSCECHLLDHDADAARQAFWWHKDQEAESHCLTPNLILTENTNAGLSSPVIVAVAVTGECKNVQLVTGTLQSVPDPGDSGVTGGSEQA